MRIDMRSDTVTQPTAAMRRAMAEAEVGDDVLDGDPTVRRLESRVAELLGKERALFFPSGTMANQTAIWLLADPGTEVLLDAGAHIVHWELGGAAALAGVQIRPVTATGAVMSAADLSAALRPPSPSYPLPSLVSVENTHNGAGGKVTRLDELRAIVAVARAAGVPVHLDGARLWNAAAATATSLAAFAACAETVMVSFSKGLGAPVGAVLAGSAAVMSDAVRVRKRFGGGMRQSGIIAAGALWGVDHHLERLGEDHERAREFAALVNGAGGAAVVPPETNIVMVDLADGVGAAAVAERAAREGVLVSVWTPTRLRAVTHLDVTEEGVRRAAEVVGRVLEGG
jgi:threonine aldolase